jgi:hypothetical protein
MPILAVCGTPKTKKEMVRRETSSTMDWYTDLTIVVASACVLGAGGRGFKKIISTVLCSLYGTM